MASLTLILHKQIDGSKTSKLASGSSGFCLQHIILVIRKLYNCNSNVFCGIYQSVVVLAKIGDCEYSSAIINPYNLKNYQYIFSSNESYWLVIIFDYWYWKKQLNWKLMV